MLKICFLKQIVENIKLIGKFRRFLKEKLLILKEYRQILKKIYKFTKKNCSKNENLRRSRGA